MLIAYEVARRMRRTGIFSSHLVARASAVSACGLAPCCGRPGRREKDQHCLFVSSLASWGNLPMMLSVSTFPMVQVPSWPSYQPGAGLASSGSVGLISRNELFLEKHGACRSAQSDIRQPRSGSRGSTTWAATPLKGTTSKSRACLTRASTTSTLTRETFFSPGPILWTKAAHELLQLLVPAALAHRYEGRTLRAPWISLCLQLSSLP